MFRGFNITEGIHFEQVVQEFQPELSDEYRGTSPRQAIPGTQVVPLLITLYSIINIF